MTGDFRTPDWPLTLAPPRDAAPFAYKLEAGTLGLLAPTPGALAIDEENRTADFCISTNRRDRGGDEMRVEGVDLSEYKLNPVVLLGHRQAVPGQPDAPLPIGTTEAPDGRLMIWREGDRLLARVHFHAHTQEAREAWELVRAGALRAASIGFDPIGEPVPLPPAPGQRRAGYLFPAWKLLELSIVVVPMNAECTIIRRCLDEGAVGQEPITPAFRKALEYALTKSEGWSEEDHPRDEAFVKLDQPRGQPGNAGQFGSFGGGPAAKPKRGRKPAAKKEPKPKEAKPSVADVAAGIRGLGGKKMSAAATAALAADLGKMTVAELTSLKRELGFTGSGPKAALAQKIAEQAAAGAKEPAAKKPAAAKPGKATSEQKIAAAKAAMKEHGATGDHAALANELSKLTVKELNDLKKEMGFTGSGPKAKLAAAIASQAVAAAPKKEPAAPPPAASSGGLHPALAAKAKEMEDALAAATHLSPEQRRSYAAAARNVMARMSPKAAERFARGTNRPPIFAADSDGVRDGIMSLVSPDVAERFRGKKGIGGAYCHGSNGNRFVLDGASGLRGQMGYNSTAGVYAHEFAHAIDGPGKEISNSPEWQAAFAAEIAGGDRLTNYGATKPSEGFAEFGRLMLSGQFPMATVRMKFPGCYAVWEKHGIAPGEASPAAKALPGPDDLKLDELFAGRIDLGEDGEDGGHADVLLGESAADAPGKDEE